MKQFIFLFLLPLFCGLTIGQGIVDYAGLTNPLCYNQLGGNNRPLKEISASNYSIIFLDSFYVASRSQIVSIISLQNSKLFPYFSHSDWVAQVNLSSSSVSYYGEIRSVYQGNDNNDPHSMVIITHIDNPSLTPGLMVTNGQIRLIATGRAGCGGPTPPSYLTLPAMPYAPMEVCFVENLGTLDYNQQAVIGPPNPPVPFVQVSVLAPSTSGPLWNYDLLDAHSAFSFPETMDVDIEQIPILMQWLTSNVLNGFNMTVVYAICPVVDMRAFLETDFSNFYFPQASRAVTFCPVFPSNFTYQISITDALYTHSIWRYKYGRADWIGYFTPDQFVITLGSAYQGLPMTALLEALQSVLDPAITVWLPQIFGVLPFNNTFVNVIPSMIRAQLSAMNYDALFPTMALNVNQNIQYQVIYPRTCIGPAAYYVDPDTMGYVEYAYLFGTYPLDSSFGVVEVNPDAYGHYLALGGIL